LSNEPLSYPTAKKFPAWSPRYVKQTYYEECYRNEPAFYGGYPPQNLNPRWRPSSHWPLELLEMAALADRWCSDRRMNDTVWPRIEKAVGKDEFEDAAFYIATQAISYLAFFREVMKKTSRQRQKAYKRIQAAALELADAIDEVPQFRYLHPFEMLSPAEIEKLVHNASHMAGFNGGSTGIIQVDNERAKLYEQNYLTIGGVIGLSVPNWQELLARIHDDAVRVATEDDNTQHTAGKQAEINFFMRSMTVEFKTKFGEYMDETLATFANVTFEQDSGTGHTAHHIAEMRRKNGIS
jgi:hypothetical protein